MAGNTSHDPGHDFGVPHIIVMLDLALNHGPYFAEDVIGIETLVRDLFYNAATTLPCNTQMCVQGCIPPLEQPCPESGA